MLRRLLPGLVTVCLGVMLLTLVLPAGIESPGYRQPNSLQPADFPTYLAWVTVTAGTLLLVAGLISGGTEAVSPGPMLPRRLVPFVAGLLAFVGAIPFIGIEAAAALFTIGMFRLASRLSWRQSLSIGLGFALAIHLIFIRLAGIPLPSSLPKGF